MPYSRYNVLILKSLFKRSQKRNPVDSLDRAFDMKARTQNCRFPHNNNLNSSNSLALYKNCRASLVVKWLRIHLVMKGTHVRSLVLEDPRCCGAPEPANGNYWVHVPQSNKRSHCNDKPLHCSSPRSPQLDKASVQQQRPSAAINT